MRPAKVVSHHSGADPGDIMLAQYSVPFNLALAAYHDPRDPDVFNDGTAADPRVRDLARRVRVTADGRPQGLERAASPLRCATAAVSRVRANTSSAARRRRCRTSSCGSSSSGSARMHGSAAIVVRRPDADRKSSFDWRAAAELTLRLSAGRGLFSLARFCARMRPNNRRGTPMSSNQSARALTRALGIATVAAVAGALLPASTIAQPGQPIEKRKAVYAPWSPDQMTQRRKELRPDRPRHRPAGARRLRFRPISRSRTSIDALMPQARAAVRQTGGRTPLGLVEPGKTRADRGRGAARLACPT